MSTVALIPTLPPTSARVEIPDSMNPEEQAKLIAELGAISTELAKAQTRDEEREKAREQRFRAIDARLGKLEKTADSSSAHDLATIQRALDKKSEQLDKWKWWAMSIIAALITSTVVGLVVHYFATKG